MGDILARLEMIALQRDNRGKINRINVLGNSLNDQYDVTASRHTTDGAHSQDSLLPIARGKITFAGGTPSVAYSQGTFGTTIADLGTGITRITLDVAASDIDYRVSVGLIGSEAVVVPNVEVLSTTSFSIYTYDFNAVGLADTNFSFAVWVN